MELPKLLTKELENRNWQNGVYDRNIQLLLDELGLSQDLDICYYGRAAIDGESKSFNEIMDTGDEEEIEMFVGKYSRKSIDGTISPELTLLIADFGLGSDQPIALDYRKNMIEPEIWMLVWSKKNYWTKISSNFENFIKGKK